MRNLLLASLLVSMNAFAIPNCQVTVSSLSVDPQVGYFEPINYQTSRVKVPDSPVTDSAMTVSLVNMDNPNDKLDQVRFC